MVVLSRPLATTQPSRLIEYGYEAVTVTSEPMPHEEEQLTTKSLPGLFR